MLDPSPYPLPAAAGRGKGVRATKSEPIESLSIKGLVDLPRRVELGKTKKTTAVVKPTTQKDFVVGLDIGTTKICCIVGEIVQDAEGSQGIDVVGIGTSPSNGLRKGVVVNIESTVKSITQAIEEAELMAGIEISNVVETPNSDSTLIIPPNLTSTSRAM